MYKFFISYNLVSEIQVVENKEESNKLYFIFPTERDINFKFDTVMFFNMIYINLVVTLYSVLPCFLEILF